MALLATAGCANHGAALIKTIPEGVEVVNLADDTVLGLTPVTVWWREGTEKRKQDPAFDPTRAKMDCRIVSLDVTGGAAAAKVEMSRDGKLVYTDYLSLLRFSDGWKIAAKVYHSHKK